MNKHITKTIIAGSLALMGCATKTGSTFPQLTEAETDTIVMQKVPDIELWCSDAMTVCDSCLIIADRCQNERLYLFRLSDFSFIQSFGQVGKGPQDCVFPFFLEKDTPKQEDEFTIYDPQLVRSKTFRVNHNQKDSLISLVEEKSIPAEIRTSTDMVQMGDCYYGSQDNGNGLFFIHRMAQDTTIWVPYPSFIANSADEMPITSRQSRIAVNLQQQKICVAMRYYNQLYLYDANGQLLKGGSFGKELMPAVAAKEEIDPMAEIFFAKIYATNKYIYLVLSDQVYGTGFTPDLPPSRIAIFDWDLKHIKTLQTNIFIYNMMIDPIYHRMIALSTDKEENPELYIYPWNE